VSDVSGTVHVVDDDPAILESLTALFESVGLPVKTYGAAEKLLEAGALEPGCLILDASMPGMSGYELFRRVRELHPEMPVLFLTAYGEIESAVQAMKDGAVDFLEKPVSTEELLERTRYALELGRRTAAARCHEHEIRRQIAQLTGREREVLSYVCEGRTSRNIAETLGISLKTIEVHRSRSLLKLKAKNVAELVRRVAAAGIRPDELRS
jgi:FixJ family two-component response regulator